MSDEPKRRRGDRRILGLPDRVVVKLIPSYLVHRRWTITNAFLVVIVGTVLGILLDKVDQNAHHIEQAVCLVIRYTEVQSRNITPQAAGPLLKLGEDMRRTGVHCPPRDKGLLNPVSP